MGTFFIKMYSKICILNFFIYTFFITIKVGGFSTKKRVITYLYKKTQQEIQAVHYIGLWYSK